MTTSLLRKAIKEASTIYWYEAKKTKPAHIQTVLVVYEGQVYPGVYANGKVVLYPDDFAPVLLESCDLWAALPIVDSLIVSELQAGRLLIWANTKPRGGKMFIAYVNQTDNGCDYTIACGKKLLELEATTYDEAMAEIKCYFFDYPDQPPKCEDEGYYLEDGLEGITLYEVSNKVILPIDEWYKEIKAQKQEAMQRKQLEAEQREYERLRQKFG